MRYSARQRGEQNQRAECSVPYEYEERLGNGAQDLDVIPAINGHPLLG